MGGFKQLSVADLRGEHSNGVGDLEAGHAQGNPAGSDDFDVRKAAC